MVRLLCVVVLLLLVEQVSSQVKPDHLYNTSMPYGVLDIRTNISASEYYYLQEDKTFSYRESTPGVRTNTFHDMTSWDSSPYRQGNLRKINNTKDDFVMNYRLLMPGNYDEHYTQGYPLLLLFHGAKERGNCFYEDCYHGDFSYDPNINNPPAPTSADHPLLNNDYHLTIGAKPHLQARDAASGKYPDDPSLSANSFPGFVLMPQMMNVWDSLNVQDVVRIIQLVAAKYQVDEDRIYVEGLSIGGYAVYEALKRAPWLFASAVAMSAVTEAANIFKHQQQSKVRHVPLWAFQGGIDKAPSPAFTESILNKFRDAGALPRYTLYPTTSHGVWTKALAEPDFYRWLLSKKKNNLHAAFGITEIDKEKNIFPVLEFAEGFYAYQWQKDESILSGETGNRLTVKEPGKYRGRFSRKSSPASDGDWSAWSLAVIITQVSNPAGDTTDTEEDDDPSGEGDTDEGGDGTDGDDSGEDDSGDGTDGDDSGGDTGDSDNDSGEDTGDETDDGDTEDDDAGGDTGGDTDDGTDDGDETGEDSGEDSSDDESGDDTDDDNSDEDGDESGDEDSGGDSDDDNSGDEDSGGDTDGGESGDDGDDDGSEDSGDENDNDDSTDDGSDTGDDDSDEDNSDGDSGDNENDDGEQPADSTEVITSIPSHLFEQIELFPNPVTSESFMIRLPGAPHHKISLIIVDALGRTYRAESREQGESFVIIPSPRLQSGLYTLIVRVNGRTHQKRLVVQ